MTKIAFYQITSSPASLLKILDEKPTGFIFRVHHNTIEELWIRQYFRELKHRLGVVSALSQLFSQFRDSNSR